jgi:hypothetical protein
MLLELITKEYLFTQPGPQRNNKGNHCSHPILVKRQKWKNQTQNLCSF